MVSIWRHCFTERVPYKRRLPIDKTTGDAEYGPETEIMALVEEDVRESIDKGGQRVTTTLRVMTETPVFPGDRVTVKGREWEIASTAEIKALRGRVDHYEARF